MQSKTIARYVEFDQRPTLDQLGIALGEDVPGWSGISLVEKDQLVSIRPDRIPAKGFAIFLVLVWLGMGGLFAIASMMGQAPPPMILAAWIFSLFVIIPMMVGMFCMTNELMGDQPYLVYDPATGIVELPRLDRQWSVAELREICFVNRARCHPSLFQVSLLVEESSGKWIYLHLYNDGGDNNCHWLPWFQNTTDRQLAQKLNIAWTYLRLRPNGTIKAHKHS